MKTALKKLLKQYFLPKWIVLAYDLAVLGSVFLFTTYLIVNFSTENVILRIAYNQTLACILIYFVVYQIIKPHHNIIRHTTLRDFSSIILANILGSAGLLGLSILGRNEVSYANFAIPIPVPVKTSLRPSSLGVNASGI